MNLPAIRPYKEQAIDLVVSVINNAKEKVGIRQTLKQLASTRNELATECKVSLNSIGAPIIRSCEKLIAETIEKKWRLTPVFQYILRYMGKSQDECAHYYYYEAVFSQPTVIYPVPQTTVSVFFRVEDMHTKSLDLKGVPMMMFRIEGHHMDHDVRYVILNIDWIFAVIKMKIQLFKRIEAMSVF